MGPLNRACPEKVPVPFIVPYEDRFWFESVMNVPDPMNVAWNRSLVNSLIPNEVNFPEPFIIPFRM